MEGLILNFLHLMCYRLPYSLHIRTFLHVLLTNPFLLVEKTASVYNLQITFLPYALTWKRAEGVQRHYQKNTDPIPTPIVFIGSPLHGEITPHCTLGYGTISKGDTGSNGSLK